MHIVVIQERVNWIHHTCMPTYLLSDIFVICAGLSMFSEGMVHMCHRHTSLYAFFSAHLRWFAIQYFNFVYHVQRIRSFYPMHPSFDSGRSNCPNLNAVHCSLLSLWFRTKHCHSIAFCFWIYKMPNSSNNKVINEFTRLLIKSIYVATKYMLHTRRVTHTYTSTHTRNAWMNTVSAYCQFDCIN